MSLESWKEEFYPVDASTPMSWVGATEHSLRKWKGLREEALQRHRVEKRRGSIKRPWHHASHILFIDATSCALCQKTASGVFPSCSKCQIKAATGKTCDSALPGQINSAYEEWLSYSNPEPMIDLLERTLEYLKANEFPAST